MVSPRLQRARRFVRSALIAATTLTLVTCAEDPVGPATGRAHLSVYPVFGPYARVAPLALDGVRIVVERVDLQAETSDTLVDARRAFDVNLDQLRIDDVSVPMQAPSEDLQVTLQLLAGTTLLWEGSQTLTVIRGQQTAATSIPVTYRGPGSNVVRLALAPRDTVISPGATFDYRLDAFDVQGAPVAQYYVSWSLTGGPAAGAAINAAGRLTAPPVDDTFYVKVVAPNGVTDSTRAIIGAGATPPAVRTWVGATGAGWFIATNWSPTGVPTATDNVVIGASTVTLDPCPAPAATADLTLQAGGQIIGACQLLVAGNLTSTGTTNVDVALTGGGKTLEGNFGAITMAVAGTVSLAGNTTVQGNIGVTAGDLTLGGHSLRATGFATAGTGTLTMTDASDSLIVSGAAIFGGGSTAGKLTAGRFLVGGSLIQTGTGSIFAPSATHRTVFTELSTLNLADTVNSGFQDLDLNGQTVTAQSAVPIKGTLSASGNSFLELPNGNQVTTAGVNVSGLTVETGTLLIQGGPITQFDGVTFGLQPATVTPLTIRHPGAATPFTFTNLQFVVTPTGGAVYINATDTDGLTNGILTINMVTPTPISPSGLIAALGGAIINWGPVAFIWNGGTSTDWSAVANWVGGILPGTTDSVVIPAGAARQPVLTAPVSVGAVTVSAGTLNLNGQTLTVSRTFATSGTGTLTSNTAASLLVVAGNAVFGGGDETGLLTDGNLRVAGNFTQGTTANSFVASGLHTTFFNGTTAQTVTVVNGGAASSRFQNLRVINAGGTVTLSGTTPELVVNGALNVTNNATLTGASAVTAAGVTTTAGSTLSVFLLTVPASGLNVAGIYGVNTTILTGGGTVPALTYTNLRLTGAAAYTLGANLATGGYLDLQSGLSVAGHKLAVGGDFSTTGAGTLTMTNVADSVTVAGATSFYGSDETGKLTAGVLRTSNQFLQDATNSPTSFIASGTHTVEIVSQNPTGGVVNLATPAVARFQNLRVLFVSTFVSEVVVNGNMEVNFNASANLFAKQVTVGGSFLKDGSGFFGPTRLILKGSSSVLVESVGPDTLEFAGTTPQTFPVFTSPTTVLVENDVTLPGLVLTIGGNLVIQGNGIFRVGPSTFNLGGSLSTTQNGQLDMTDPGAVLAAGGDATFAGGSTGGLLTAGTLSIGGNFTQKANGSLTTTYSPSGTHKTVFVNTATKAISMGSPGLGAAGSHFQVLDVSGATGGLTLDVNMQADSIISTSAAAKISSPGVTLTVRRSQISGLTLSTTNFVLDEQLVGAAEMFDNVTFAGFSGFGSMLTVIGPGGAAAPRTLTLNNVTFPTLTAADNGLYVALTSSNLLGFNLIMNGSNQGPPLGNGSLFTSVTPLTGVAFITWQ